MHILHGYAFLGICWWACVENVLRLLPNDGNNDCYNASQVKSQFRNVRRRNCFALRHIFPDPSWNDFFLICCVSRDSFGRQWKMNA